MRSEPLPSGPRISGGRRNDAILLFVNSDDFPMIKETGAIAWDDNWL